MAFSNELGMVPLQYDTAGIPSATFSGALLLDATAEKGAFVGYVWHPTVKTGSINIRKVHFKTGSVSINASSEFRVSLQDVSMTAGPPYQPDGTQDQTYDFKTATAVLTANAWKTTGNLSADRVVDLSVTDPAGTNPRLIAVVFEYQVFTAADSVIIHTAAENNGTSWPVGLAGYAMLNTGSYASVARTPLVVLECDDGTFAFLLGCRPWSNITTASVSSTGAIRRAGVKFSVPTTRKIDRFGMTLAIPNGCDGSLVLYDTDGTTALVTVPIDNDAVIGTGTSAFEAPFQPVTLTASSFYRLAFVGGTATAATVPYVEVNAVGHMDGAILGQNAHWTQHDGANWTDTTTRRPFFALGFSAFPHQARSSFVLGI